MITEVTIRDNVVYLNSKDAKLWCKKHAQSFDDKGKFISKACSDVCIVKALSCYQNRDYQKAFEFFHKAACRLGTNDGFELARNALGDDYESFRLQLSISRTANDATNAPAKQVTPAVPAAASNEAEKQAEPKPPEAAAANDAANAQPKQVTPAVPAAASNEADKQAEPKPQEATDIKDGAKEQGAKPVVAANGAANPQQEQAVKATAIEVVKPNFEMLADHSIDSALIEKLKKETEADDYSNFSEFLKNITEDSVNAMNQAKLLPVIVEMFEKGIEDDEITVELARQVIGLLSKCKLVNDQVFKPNINLVSKDDKKFPSNKALCLVCIPHYFTPAFKKYAEKECGEIQFPLFSERCVLILRNFAYHKDYIFEAYTTLEDCVLLYTFGQSVMLDKLIKLMLDHMLYLAGQSETEEKLQKSLTSIDAFYKAKENSLEAEAEAKVEASVSVKLEQEVILQLIARAFSDYFKGKYKVDLKCRLASDVLAVPVQALAEVRKDSIIGTYLRQFFTCISVDELSEDARKKLNIVLMADCSKVVAKFTAINIVFTKETKVDVVVKDIQRLFSVFKQIKDGYFNHTGAMDILEKINFQNKIFRSDSSAIFMWDFDKIWEKFTYIVGITDQTKIYLGANVQDAEKEQFQKRFQEKIQRRIKALTRTKDVQNIAQITFADE